MSEHDNVLVWIDDKEARVFRFDVEGFDRASVRSAHPDRHVRRDTGRGSGFSAALSKSFFPRVAKALDDAGAILITGPANTKAELAEFLGRSWPQLAARVSGVASLDRPTNHALVSLVRDFFDGGTRQRSGR
ncbi:MAG: hypothetical protein WDO68_16905 [Gammaproteobacteria bacterium]